MKKLKQSLRMLVGMVFLAAGTGLPVGCGGEGIEPPTTGSLAITATTTGPSPDPDGYSITLDGIDRGALVSNGATLDDLTPGSHVVGLSGVAANCEVQGDNPRTMTIRAGESATTAFAIICAAPPPVTGSIRVTTSSSGSDPDPDGYAFALDGGPTQPIGGSATVILTAVPVGDHLLLLSGLAGNCSVQGTNPRSISVSGGTTAEMGFAVTCTAATGSIEITTATSGDSPDQDGYIVTLNNGAPQTIGPTGSLNLPGVSPGSYQMTLSGIAPNCRVEGSNPRSITVIAGARTAVAFSVNCPGLQGSKIAFTRYARTENSGIYVMNGDGSEQIRVAPSGSSPAWSPDRRKIAFSSGNEIYIMDADGANRSKLTNVTWTTIFGLRWSPNGSKIAFDTYCCEYTGESWDIWVVPSVGSQQSRVARHAFDPEWSPDGSKIAFHTGSIYTMNVDGSGVTVLAAGGGLGVPAWSPDGSRIAFSSDYHSSSAAAWTHKIETIRPDGTGRVALMSGSGRIAQRLAWSPDGTMIAFETDRSGSWDVWIMHADGSGQTNLTNQPGFEHDPSWSPDGRKLALVMSDQGDSSSQIFVVNIDGTGLVNVSNSPDTEDVEPSWAFR